MSSLSATWTLVTVAYNSATVLRRYWEHPRPNNIEWIVVDNSPDRATTIEALRLGATQVVHLPRNPGFAAANEPLHGRVCRVR